MKLTVMIIFCALLILLLLSRPPKPKLPAALDFGPTTLNEISGKHIYPNIAVLIEFRKTNQLFTVIHNVNYHIPPTWPIQIFHGRENKDFIKKSSINRLLTSGKIILSLLNGSFAKAQTYKPFTDPSFWESIRGEKVLFFHTESIMCGNSPHRVTDYLKYDYVSAPQMPDAVKYCQTEFTHGGSFSIRSRSKSLALLAMISYNPTLPEDVWYSENLRLVNGTKAPVSVAKTFSVGTLFYERPLAVNQLCLEESLRRQLFRTCPEAQMLLSGICK